MKATTEEEVEMKRKKRLTIKLVALGLAVAAIAPTAAQAYLDEGGSGGTQFVSVDDRPVHGMSYSTYSEPNVVVSSDDRAVSRMSPTTNQPSLVSSDDGFELGTLGMTGIILALGAAGAALIAVRETRRHRLAGV
jgi:hypothetical protein